MWEREKEARCSFWLWNVLGGGSRSKKRKCILKNKMSCMPSINKHTAHMAERRIREKTANNVPGIQTPQERANILGAQGFPLYAWALHILVSRLPAFPNYWCCHSKWRRRSWEQPGPRECVVLRWAARPGHTTLVSITASLSKLTVGS